MNKTGHGRWGRYRKVGDVEQKICNGPLHPPEGAWLPLRSFWFHKSGQRKGKPMARCQECTKVGKGRDPRTSGFVPISEYWWILLELRRRLGKAETLRRMGISANFWYRVEHGIYINMRRATAGKAVKLLAEVRQNDEVRHKSSIKRGATARGEKERVPTKRADTIEYDRKRKREG